MASQVLQKARDYEQQNEVFIEKTDRPQFHLSPRVGWMNDPNGFSVYRGSYHLFYQYHPYSTHWGPMHWGHAVSKDLVRWEYLPCAIAPDHAYDKFGCFSGSAIEMPDGRQLLLYTAVRSERQKGVLKSWQTQAIAMGNGTDFEKYSGNPVIREDQIPEGFSVHDFRDPKIWREEDGTYGCVVGNRTEDGSGAILLYRSEDCIHWSFDGIVDRSYNQYGRMWECPDFFELDGTRLLIISPQDMSAMGHEFHNGNNSICLAGSFDRETCEFRREHIQSVDYGLDFYAPQTLLSPDGRRIMIAWMQNWDTCAVPYEEPRLFGQMTCARELRWQNGRLFQLPVRELEQYRGRRVYFPNIDLAEELALPGVFGRCVDMTVSIEPQEYKHFRIKVARGSQHYTSISYRPESGLLRISREHSGFIRDFNHVRECLVPNNGGAIKLRILLDNNSVEVFVNDGEYAFSNVIYTPMSANGITFESRTKMRFSVEKYDLNF